MYHRDAPFASHSAPAPLRPAPTATIVIPCYNEEAMIPRLLARLARLDEELRGAGLIAAPLTVLLVDDRSTDRTWELICAGGYGLAVSGLRLSRNEGHQSALLAGLLHARGDVVVSMDADLQDDPSAMAAMIEAWRNGAEIVYGVRAARNSDSRFKRVTARSYYRILRWLGVDVLVDHADYRLMGRKALTALSGLTERNLFLRGMVRQLGFCSAVVTYERAPRLAGESKYPLAKMVALALEGITSYSVKPLRLITWTGFATAIGSFCLAIYALASWILGVAVPGWTSTVLPIYFLGGMHLIALGIIGEYIGKIYLETKARPRFVIDEMFETRERIGAMESISSDRKVGSAQAA